MRPTRGVIVAVATAVAAARGTQAFVPPTASSSCQTGAGSQRQQQQHTCSAVQRRRSSTTALPAAPAGKAGPEGGENHSSITEGERPQQQQKRQQKRRWAAGARRSLVRGAASLATFTLGATALSGLSADVQHRLNSGDGAAAAAEVSLPGAMKSAQASVLKPFDKRTVEEKLANLPAFMVTNAKGSPYLSPTQPGEPQLAVFYTNLADAKDNLREMIQAPAYEKDARIMVVSMEKAYSMVKAGPRGTGYERDDGVEELMDFKLERDMHSLIKARRLGLDIGPAAFNIPIPVFYAEGLEVKRDGALVKPLFMDPADLVAAWKKAAASNPDMPAAPKVKVLNMPDVIVAMEVTDEFNHFGFFASTESAEYIQQGREAAKPLPKPRLGRMWAF